MSRARRWEKTERQGFEDALESGRRDPANRSDLDQLAYDRGFDRGRRAVDRIRETAAAPSSGAVHLDAAEQAVMDHILAAMHGVEDLGLQANQAELAIHVHGLQAFVIQHMLQRLAPGQRGAWFEDAPTAITLPGLTTSDTAVATGRVWLSEWSARGRAPVDGIWVEFRNVDERRQRIYVEATP